MILPTDSQPIRSSLVIGVLAICCASHATTSSKSRVYGARALAHGTASSASAPQRRQSRRRNSHSIR
ncbi:MAG: hypothetical protein LC777_09225, partial [Actinobacteria bacterium]|nr:hypothetical protein [Actinomycetota bacterium]